MGRIFVALMFVFALVGWACQIERVKPPDVLIITLDTTRADYISTYGSARAATPSIDRLAADGVVFEQAVSVAPLTLPAHTSLFTGLLPFRHGVRDNAAAPLGADHETLAEILRRRGYQTAAFVSSAILKADRGLASGFDTYDDHSGSSRTASGGLQRPADETVNAAIRWLDRRADKPFFLWVHLNDPHAPYDPPEPFRTAYRDDPYAGEVAFADEQIGRLTDFLNGRWLLDRTAVIITADHGESLQEHGEAGHGIFLYQSVVHVPLIIRAPVLRARRVPEVVRLVDVMPTILELTHTDRPAAGVDGISLIDLARGRGDLDRDAYSESLYPLRFGWSPLHSLRNGRFKLIAAPRPELYDLERDPEELHNLLSARSALGLAMARRLAEIEPAASGNDRGAGSSPPSEIVERLGALGYITRTPTMAKPTRGPLPDPKDRIGEYNALARRRSEAQGRK